MWDFLTKIWLCLAISAILGGIIGWLLKTLFGCKCANVEEYEAEIARLKASAGSASADSSAENAKDDAQIARLKASAGSASADSSAENAKDDAEIASLRKQIKTLESDLEICHERQATMEGELKDWSAKAAALSGAGAVVAGDGDSAKLQAELDACRVRLDECESEKAYLLNQVKKAESGESIKREVPMDQRDDLELINGVGPVLERMLYDMGIYFFKDIAGWDAAKIAEINEKLPNFRGRIEREGWVESAKEEHFKKYGERL